MLRKSTQTVRLVAALSGIASASSGRRPGVRSGSCEHGFIDPATWVRGPLYARAREPPDLESGQDQADERQEIAWAPLARSALPTTARSGEGRNGKCRPATPPGSRCSTRISTGRRRGPCGRSPALTYRTGPGKPGAYAGVAHLDTHKRDIQKALDGGAMVLIIPTVDSVEEAQDIIDLVFYPPIGHRKYGPSQAQTMYANVPGGYRQTFNDNVVIILMIETILGSQEANAIGALPHIDGLFGATSDLGNFSGYGNANVDYEKLIRNTYDAAHSHGAGACTAFGFRDRVANATSLRPTAVSRTRSTATRTDRPATFDVAGQRLRKHRSPTIDTARQPEQSEEKSHDAFESEANEDETRCCRVVAAAAMAASQSALGQACPATGCTIPGITVPNGFTTCPGTGTDVMSSFTY